MIAAGNLGGRKEIIDDWKAWNATLGFMRPLLVGLLFLVSCSSPYLKNRTRDGLDILTLEVQTKTYGASVRTGPIKFGMSYKSPQGLDAGLRGGDFGRHASAEFTAFAMGPDYFQKLPFSDLGNEPAAQDSESTPPEKEAKPADEGEQSVERAKQNGGEATRTEAANTEAGQDSEAEKAALLMRLRGKEYRVRSPFGTTVPLQQRKLVLKKRGSFAPASYYTQIDLNLALYFGIRVGLNPGELIDAILGWTTIDIFSDDEPFESDQEKKLKENPLYNSLSEEQKQKLREQLSR
ncbi:MAG: hypothetical protein JNM27_19535 [Leptospirales bacterium]|nr:hypothetical protein [Leptospirales bacterium]